MTTIVVAAGLCSAIRPKLLTALPPERYPNVKITAWGEGHWHIPCPDSQVFPDADIWVKKHVAHIEVNGDATFAKWCEYVICRLIAAENNRQVAGKGGAWLYLMSKPLEPRNRQWAAKWDTLPEPGEWVQRGCKHVAPQEKTAQARSKPRQPRTQRWQARRRGGIVGAIINLFKGG